MGVQYLKCSAKYNDFCGENKNCLEESWEELEERSQMAVAGNRYYDAAKYRESYLRGRGIDFVHDSELNDDEQYPIDLSRNRCA